MHESVLEHRSKDTAAFRDRAGVVAAVLCAAHCAALPLVAGVLSALGLAILLDERMEVALLMLAGLIGVWSLWPAFRRQHRRLLPLLLFASGLLVMGATRLLEGRSASVEISMVVVGAVAVATAHLVNLRLCRQCRRCDDD